MKAVFGMKSFGWGFVTTVAMGLLAVSTPVKAADPAPAPAPAKPTASSSLSDSAPHEGIKIEPYTGPPIYLEEQEQVAAPTIVTRENLPEKYDDGKTMRVEREVAHYSDNNFAADGKYREYHPNGKPFIEGQFKAGRQTGEWTYYFENGQVNRKATYVDGKPNGSWEVFRADGTLSAKRGFKDGVRDGEWITYDATGKQPLAEEHYANGEEDGVLKVWFPNGKLSKQVSFKNGKREGASTEWDDKGQKLVDAEWRDNKLNGTATRYFPDGKTIVQKYKAGRFESELKQ
jgi:antitoxin component YwqK of YwqJK toxin-antitoxin module